MPLPMYRERKYWGSVKKETAAPPKRVRKWFTGPSMAKKLFSMPTMTIMEMK